MSTRSLEKNRRDARKHYAKNRERRLPQMRQYAAEHREERKAYMKTYQQEHREELSMKNRVRRSANLEETLAKEAAYRKINSAKRVAYNKQYVRLHPEMKRRADAIYRKKHPEQIEGHRETYRALKKNAPINDLSALQWREIQAVCDHRCVYCRKRAKGHLTQDHIMPLSKGGSHTVSNVVPACQSCNSRKNNGAPLTAVQPLLLTLAPRKNHEMAG